jgi:hypothetical protein
MWVSVWIENGRPVQVESSSYPEAIVVFQKWKESEANAQQGFLVDGQPVYFLTYLKVPPIVEGESIG